MSGQGWLEYSVLKVLPTGEVVTTVDLATLDRNVLDSSKCQPGRYHPVLSYVLLCAYRGRTRRRRGKAYHVRR